MTDRRFLVGQKVLVSRDESGENHEEATVIDFYELLIGEDKRPMVVVDFDDGERKYMAALAPNVVAVEPVVDEDGEPAVGEAASEGDDATSTNAVETGPEDDDAA